MKIFLCLITLILIASGCQTISGGNSERAMETADISVVKASKSHIIDVEVDQNLKSRLNRVYFYNIVEGDSRYVLLSGSVTKQMGGVSIDRKKINVSFLNDNGDILSEKTDRISISYMRRPRGSKGKFSTKLPYSSEIRKCVIALEVNSKE